MSESTVVIMQTNRGDIEIELNAAKAPKTVANFLSYVDDGFFDGTIFHRVIPGFMIQGGGFTPEMEQKSTKPTIQNEATNGLRNDRGTIAMARTPNPHSASSQFFVNLANNDFLNFSGQNMQGWGYCVFGKVTKGMETVDEIAKVRTGNSGPHGDVPKETIEIISVKRK